jgi:hypothetical protein
VFAYFYAPPPPPPLLHDSVLLLNKSDATQAQQLRLQCAHYLLMLPCHGPTCLLLWRRDRCCLLQLLRCPCSSKIWCGWCGLGGHLLPMCHHGWRACHDAADIQVHLIWQPREGTYRHACCNCQERQQGPAGRCMVRYCCGVFCERIVSAAAPNGGLAATWLPGCWIVQGFGNQPLGNRCVCNLALRVADIPEHV